MAIYICVFKAHSIESPKFDREQVVRRDGLHRHKHNKKSYAITQPPTYDETNRGRLTFPC